MADVADYVRVLRALLRGEETTWEGTPIRMLHPDGFGAARPVDVPILVGADGPTGLAVAGQLADGVFSAGRPIEGDGPSWRAQLAFGTVLEDGESPTDERVVAAAVTEPAYQPAGPDIPGELARMRHALT